LFSFANVSETKLVNRPKLSVYVKILQKPGSQGRIYILHAQMPCKKIQAAPDRAGEADSSPRFLSWCEGSLPDERYSDWPRRLLESLLTS